MIETCHRCGNPKSTETVFCDHCSLLQPETSGSPHPRERCDYAVAFVDNSTGDHDTGLCIATWNGESFVSVDSDRPLLQYQGDAILEFWPLEQGTGTRFPGKAD